MAPQTLVVRNEASFNPEGKVVVQVEGEKRVDGKWGGQLQAAKEKNWSIFLELDKYTETLAGQVVTRGNYSRVRDFELVPANVKIHAS